MPVNYLKLINRKGEAMRHTETCPRSGGGWTDDEILAVWNKGSMVPGYDPAEYRQDIHGSLMEFSKYGETVDGGYGWEIDHIKPVIAGGKHELSNLQPLQWQNNRAKGDSWPGADTNGAKVNQNWL